LKRQPKITKEEIGEELDDNQSEINDAVNTLLQEK
jgi:predicted transcriptional regulator